MSRPAAKNGRVLMSPLKRIRSLSRPAALVWSVWALLSISLIAYVARYGHNVPYYDEWGLAWVLDGRQPLDAPWLWQQVNDHRIPLPKLILVGLLSAFSWDFRTGMFFDALALIALAALLVGTASQVRERASYADVFFPLLLLHWGNYEYLLWNWQVTQIIPVAIVLALLSVVMTSGLLPSFWTLILSSVGVILLPLSGVPGLAYTPGLAAWLLLAGVRAWRLEESNARMRAIVAWCSGGLALLLIPVYFIGLNSTVQGVPDPSSIALAAASFVVHALGPGGPALEPVTSIVLLVAALVSLAGLSNQIWTGGALRQDAIAALLFLIGFVGLVTAVSVARPDTAFPPRYTLQATPFLCWMFLAGGKFARPALARSVQAALALLAVAALGSNFIAGLNYAEARDHQLTNFEADIRKGTSPSELIARHHRTIFPFPEEGGASWHDGLWFSLNVLRKERIGAFASLEQDPSFTEVPIEEVASEIHSTTSRSYSFAPPRFIHGIRLEALPYPTRGYVDITTVVSWTTGDLEFSEDRRCVHKWLPHETFATCWIYGVVKDTKISSAPAAGEVGWPRFNVLVPVAD